MGLPVGRGWRPMMLKNGIQVAEQSMTCNTPLWPFLGLDGRSERPPPINRLVTSSPSTYMIFSTLFIIWVLEGDDWGSTCPMNDLKLYLMVRFQFWKFGECGAPLHHNYSSVSVRVPSMGYIDKNWVHKNVFKNNWVWKQTVYPTRIKKKLFGMNKTRFDMP